MNQQRAKQGLSITKRFKLLFKQERAICPYEVSYLDTWRPLCILCCKCKISDARKMSSNSIWKNAPAFGVRSYLGMGFHGTSEALARLEFWKCIQLVYTGLFTELQRKCDLLHESFHAELSNLKLRHVIRIFWGMCISISRWLLL